MELADIFRAHGAAWCAANKGHVSLGQLRAISAIKACRTAALGGHVAQCEGCTHTVIDYNSCRKRPCPQCQGSAAREWLAEREAELLELHTTWSSRWAAVADLAYQNKEVIYDILFRASAETMLTIAADPKHLGARIGITSVLHTWGSAMTHHPHVHMIVPGGGISLDGTRWVSCKPGFFLPVRVLSRLYRRLFLEMLIAAHKADRLQFFNAHAALADFKTFAAWVSALRQVEWGFAQASVRWTGTGAGLPVALHAPHCHLESSAGGVGRHWRDVQMQGLSPRRAGSLQDDDAVGRRVHPPVPDARAAEALPPHSPLRAVRQRCACRQHCAGARAVEDGGGRQSASVH